MFNEHQQGDLNSVVRFYDLLTSKLGKETTENLTTFIAENIKEEVENKTQRLATKEDLATRRSISSSGYLLFG
jgi:hypothetical protein